MTAPKEKTEGLREQKRQQTKLRITEAGLKLFATHGYDATTLDAIATEAGISRRTFFHYFKSKDEILLSLQSGLGDQLLAALAEEPPTERPLHAIRSAMLRIAGTYSLDDLIAIDRLMLASEGVQARKQASYVRDEAMVFEALKQRWPSEPEMALRVVAQLSIGLTRLSLDAWRSEGARRPIAKVLEEAFNALGAEFSSR